MPMARVTPTSVGRWCDSNHCFSITPSFLAFSFAAMYYTIYEPLSNAYLILVASLESL